MAYEIPGRALGTLVANADLRTSQYLFGLINGSGKIAVAAANGPADGVIQNKPNTDEAVTLMREGVSKVVASGAIAAGASVAVGTGGKAKTAASGNVIVGKALTAAGADGEIFTVDLDYRGVA